MSGSLTRLVVSEKGDSVKASKVFKNALMSVIYVILVKIVLNYQGDVFGAKKEKNAFSFHLTLRSICMVSVNLGLTRMPKQCISANHVRPKGIALPAWKVWDAVGVMTGRILPWANASKAISIGNFDFIELDF